MTSKRWQEWWSARQFKRADVSTDTTPALGFEALSRSPRLLRGAACLTALVMALAAALSVTSMWKSSDAASGAEESINLAGRQRMLSERIALLGLQLAHSTAHSDQLVDHLTLALQQLAEDRFRLTESPAFQRQEVLLPPLAPLEQAGLAILAPTDREQRERGAVALIEAAEVFLPAMDAAVMQMQRNVASRAARDVANQVWQTVAVAVAMVAALVGTGFGLAGYVERLNRQVRAMAAERERLALVAERTNNAAIITDREGLVLWVNDAFTRISGYTLGEVMGRKPGAVLQFEGTDPTTRHRLAEALAAEQAIQVEILNRSKGGQSYWLLLDIQPIRALSGACTGFSAIETDITAQVQAREQLESLLRALPAGVVEQDASGKIVKTNPEALRILGLTREQLLGRTSIDPRWRTVHEDGSPMPGAEHPAMVVLSTGLPQRNVTMGVASPDGAMHWLRVNSEPLRSSANKVLGAVTSFIDVTEASSQRRLLNLTVQAAGLGTWEWWVESGAVRFNDGWWQMLGYAPGHLPASFETWNSLVCPEDIDATKSALKRHLDGEASQYRCEFRMRCADGSWSWIMAAGAVIERSADGSALRMAGIHLDINARKALEMQLSDAALTDSLTGLPNRGALKVRLARCAGLAKRDPGYRYALLFMDFDRFKLVNDSLGHEAGDELLRQIASRLRATLRPGDDLARLEFGSYEATRLGGDEFVALLEPLPRPEDVTVVAQRLLRALAEPYRVAGQDVSSTASIGIAINSSHCQDPEELLRRADSAMYEAKRRGRGQFVQYSQTA